MIFFIKCIPSARESIKVCRGEWSLPECYKEVLFNWWSTWFTKGGKWDDVDALSYTLASGKQSSCTRWSFHFFKESEKSLNETPMWSTDGGTCGSPCRDGGQRSKGHPCSMDGAEGSQTYQYMRGIDRGWGLWVGAAEACKMRWLLDKGQESVCVCCSGWNWIHVTWVQVQGNFYAKYMQEK